MSSVPQAAAGQALISLRNVTKTYALGARDIVAVNAIDLEIQQGECVAVVGKSGSGKTTLINLLTGIDTPSSGELQVDGMPVHALSQDQLAQWRGRQVGVVFQFFQLLPTLTVAENVILPMEFGGVIPRAARHKRAIELLDRMGIVDQAGKRPGDLSGGQQQRAAIARALANDPPIVVADEPTGNLDSATADEVMGFLAGLARDGKTVLTVTHERELTQFFTRVVTLRDGVIERDEAVN